MKKQSKNFTNTIKANDAFWDSFMVYSARLRLGESIIKARQEQELNQTQLAKKAKTTQRVVSNIENAEMNLGFDLLYRIVKSLNFSSDYVSYVFETPSNNETGITQCVYRTVIPNRDAYIENDSQVTLQDKKTPANAKVTKIPFLVK